ncbi:MAG TPA: DnaA/Hda family protein, partial [Candidatus Dormibacteraeota bacterium]|nr:DnaA/Hda family protein [Candidatus Dormibacteraeota bacterium]
MVTDLQRPDPAEIWRLAHEELRDQITMPGYEMWIRSTILVRCDDGRHFVIGAPTVLAVEMLRSKYAAIIRDTLSDLVMGDVEIEIELDPTAEPLDRPAPLPDDDPVEPGPAYPLPSSLSGSSIARLNPGFTFEKFVVGSSTLFAHAACRAVADAPGRAYNPLFLYGGVGLGKTHLMQAIGHAVRDGHVRAPRVAYVTTEKFVNELVVAIQENSQQKFRDRYRNVDVLL